jgi:hypothetical protein
MKPPERRYTRLLLLFLRRATACLLAASLALLLSGCGQGDSGAQNQPVTDADAVRFLEQATWGPSEAGIREVQQKGLETFIDEQFAAPASNVGAYPYASLSVEVGCPLTMPNRLVCTRDNYSSFPLQIKFFQNALNRPDQLRQRLAFALSQILVLSSAPQAYQAYALAPYQNFLMENAFGNFRDILSGITLNPAMGRYLNMVNNAKADPVRGVVPNENFARELLQLFSIGVFKLNNDGTFRRDSAGKPIPAYDQDTVEGFARAFTGWTYPTQPGNTTQWPNPPYYIGPMISIPSFHDTEAKKLLDGVVLPAHQTPEKDLNDALTNVFNHPNVGPFVGKQLIQHFVTSNPSLAYVSRISGVFHNNGQGVRGDMKAVIRAILLDPEARGDAKTDPEFGKLREPAKFIVGILRALGGQSDGVFLRAQSRLLGQNIYQAPSVFNFYPPDYPLQGTNLVNPVSAIYTTTTVLDRSNFVYGLLYGSSDMLPDPLVTGAIGTKVDLSPLAALAAVPEKLVDKLDMLMMHNSMSDVMHSIIIDAINAVPASDPLARARTAVYLVATSPQYQVER